MKKPTPMMDMAKPLENGGEQHGSFTFTKDGWTFQCVQYDYRHTDGRPFTCVAPTLEKARAKRDAWLAGRGGKR